MGILKPRRVSPNHPSVMSRHEPVVRPEQRLEASGDFAHYLRRSMGHVA